MVMSMKKVKASITSFFLALAAGIILTSIIPLLPNPLFSPLDFGPLDYRPRLQAYAESHDGALTVKVFRQRNPEYSLYVGVEMYVRVYDRDGRMLYEKLIARDGAWDELNGAYKNITFDGNLIRINHYWNKVHVINRSDLLR